MDERAWQKQVIETAHMFGWKVAHFRPLLDSRKRWRTPVEADGKGWPDLVLVRDSVIYAELKTDAPDSDVTEEQRQWLMRLDEAGAETAVWRPRDAEAVMQRLARRREKRGA